MSRNTIDTRDLYKRQQELQDLKDAVENAKEELDQLSTGKPDEDDELEAFEEWEKEIEAAQSTLDDAQAEFGTDEQEELEELDGLESEIGRGWRDGETMIPEYEFEDYARELADDIGGTKDDVWPYTCIDWERAAKELAMDYTTVSYQGSDYYVRS